jgi:hypothetical protein
VETVYHLIVFPAEMALRFEVPPQAIVDGVAVTGVGATGGAAKVIGQQNVGLVEVQLDAVTQMFPTVAPNVTEMLVVP